ncbi:MAG: FadR family transcriptional regulator [Rhodospirillales bacterium]|nr:FadR family transcriptional regulator [Rhodospirillales bacterium]
MTRQQKSRSESRSQRGGEILAPVRPTRNLTEAVVLRLTEEITSGRLTAGQRLPTEQEMVSAMKVSRTVVREAVAALKAQGLVITRQGSGAFVSAVPQRRTFKLDPEVLRTLDSAIDVLELRLALETEAAGLACERGSAAGIRAVSSAHAEFERALARGESGAEQDFAFHVAISTATGNSQFAEFLRFLGTFVIPRQDKRVWNMTVTRQTEYLAQIRDEHARIAEAIAARRPDAARAAMRMHLTRAAARYRKFSGSAKAGEAA